MSNIEEIEVVKKVQKCISQIMKDDEIRHLSVELVKSGLKPEQVRDHIIDIITMYIITNQ